MMMESFNFVNFTIAIALILLWMSTSSLMYCMIFLILIQTKTKLMEFVMHEWKQMEKAREDNDHFSIEHYIFFRIDCLYSRHRVFKGYLLLVSTITLIIVGGLLWYVSTDSSLIESFWAAWTFIADAGTHTGQANMSQRIIGVAITLGGMIIFALIIGIISDEVSSLMDGLRKGTSSVIAINHTLILNHSDKLIPTIAQIALANKSIGGAPIVILSEVGKQDLERQITRSGVELFGSEVIVRTGVPYLTSDLSRVSARNARSIIVLSDRTQGNADMSDVNAVRTVLCLSHMKAPKNGFIVCEVCDIDNEQLVKSVGKESVETFVSHDIIGRLMIQCARERGLSNVLESLLGFEGDEFYIKQWPRLKGLTFGELMYRFEGNLCITIYLLLTACVPPSPPNIYHHNLFAHRMCLSLTT